VLRFDFEPDLVNDDDDVCSSVLCFDFEPDIVNDDDDDDGYVAMMLDDDGGGGGEYWTLIYLFPSLSYIIAFFTYSTTLSSLYLLFYLMSIPQLSTSLHIQT